MSARKVRFAPEPPKHRSPIFHKRSRAINKELLKTYFPLQRTNGLPGELTFSEIAMLCLKLEDCNVERVSPETTDSGACSSSSFSTVEEISYAMDIEPVPLTTSKPTEEQCDANDANG